jgi:hypothetical protein
MDDIIEYISAGNRPVPWTGKWSIPSPFLDSRLKISKHHSPTNFHLTRGLLPSFLWHYSQNLALASSYEVS